MVEAGLGAGIGREKAEAEQQAGGMQVGGRPGPGTGVLGGRRHVGPGREKG